jgi:hypothetical protein
MKKLILASLSILAMSGSAFAGEARVGNLVDVRAVSSSAQIDMNRHTSGGDYTNSVATATKNETISETINLPDGVGTKEINATIAATTVTTGSSYSHFNEDLSVKNNEYTNGFTQVVEGYGSF